MMDTALLKQKLHDYIDTAEEKKLEAIYTILESEIDEGNWWDDKKLLAEIESREQESLKDDVKTFSLDEAVNFARQSLKKS
jgi:hypothetical protein